MKPTDSTVTQARSREGSSAAVARAGASAHEATDPLCMLLDQLASVIDAMTDAHYAQKPVGVVQSSIGSHVRHCLDHVRSLLEAVESGQLCYDNRRRGTPEETDRAVATALVRQLSQELLDLPADLLDQDLTLSVMMTADGQPLRVRSTFGREMAYVLAHTIHHNALVGTMAKTLGAWLPETFGYAPSTLKHMEQPHMEQPACAR